MNKRMLIKKVRDSTGRTAVLPELSRLLDLSEASLVAKTNGKRQFKPDEIDKIRIEYKMTDSEVVDVFIKQGEDACMQ